jgi:hypothetical protein
MPNLPLPPAQDFPRVWRPKAQDREAALVEHYETSPGWGYFPAKAIAPKLVSGELSLLAATAGLQKIQHDVARKQNIEVVEALHGLPFARGALCFRPPCSFLELGRDARLKIRADIAFSRERIPYLVLLQVRKFNALSTPFEQSAWASLARRALRIGDFKNAEMFIWDLRAAEKGSPRSATEVKLGPLTEMAEAELNALINDVLDARQALMDKGYIRPTRPKRDGKDKGSELPSLL